MILLAAAPARQAALHAGLQQRGLAVTNVADDAGQLLAGWDVNHWAMIVCDVELWQDPDAMLADLQGRAHIPLVAVIPADLAPDNIAWLREQLGCWAILSLSEDSRQLNGDLPPLPVPEPAPLPVVPVAPVVPHAAAGHPPHPGPAPAAAEPQPVAQPAPAAQEPVARAVPPAAPAAPPAGGLRCAAFWGLERGYGATTLLMATAQAAVATRIPTVIVSLAAPCLIPIYAGLQPGGPTLLTWQQAVADGHQDPLGAALQEHRGISIIAGPASGREMDAFRLAATQEAAQGLPALIADATRAGYSFVLVDAPAGSGLDREALAECNEIVITASGSFRGAALLTHSLAEAAPHRNIRAVTAVVNRRAGQDWKVRRMQSEVGRTKGRQPDRWVSLDEDPAIRTAHNQGHPPIVESERLQEAAVELQMLLYPVSGQGAPPPRKRGGLLAALKRR